VTISAEKWASANLLVRALAGRWTLCILSQLSEGGRRYRDLHDSLDGISHKVLTDTLRRAERDGLVKRHVDTDRVETATLYQLTDLARTLKDPVESLARWIDVNWKTVDAARDEWDLRR
jgi:DNA-binding HxlR family transcriptional regulator